MSTNDHLAASVDRCDVCEAYVHPLLAACPFCATERGAGHAEARQAWERENRSLTEDEARAEILRLFGATYEIRESLIRVFQDPATRRKMKPRGATGLADRLANAPISQLALRYTGGLPGIPGHPDVSMQIDRGALTLTDARSGSRLIVVALANVLAVQAFTADADLMDGWVGLSFGGATVLQRPTFSGGALVVVHGVDASVLQWGVGNRPGFFTRKADFAGFAMMRTGLATGASLYARKRFGSVDPALWARELGLAAERP